ncbi:MAG: hypothetical protein R2795_22615 [Saprospiraceae bacterium]
MEFGKLEDIEGVDFTLPNGRVYTTSIPSESTSLQVYAGCTGWGMPAWVSRWYPTGTKPRDFLAAYGGSSIPLN